MGKIEEDWTKKYNELVIQYEDKAELKKILEDKKRQMTDIKELCPLDGYSYRELELIDKINALVKIVNNQQDRIQTLEDINKIRAEMAFDRVDRIKHGTL